MLNISLDSSSIFVKSPWPEIRVFHRLRGTPNFPNIFVTFTTFWGWFDLCGPVTERPMRLITIVTRRQENVMPIHVLFADLILSAKKVWTWLQFIVSPETDEVLDPANFRLNLGLLALRIWIEIPVRSWYNRRQGWIHWIISKVTLSTQNSSDHSRVDFLNFWLR